MEFTTPPDDSPLDAAHRANPEGTTVSRPVTRSPRIQVLWRPDCPQCFRLRDGLRQAGISTAEHNIREDPAAAARVRAAAGGDETVPTVLVGRQALVNPSIAEVVTAVRTEVSEKVEDLVGNAAAVPQSARSAMWPPFLWTLAGSLAWLALAAWRPTTTWHLAPLLVAAAAPWVIGQDLRGGDRGAVRRVLQAAVIGLVVSALVTWGLETAGLLRGPTIMGPLDPRTESFLLAGAGAVLAAVVGVARALRTPAAARSVWVGEHLLARSDDVVMVEGDAYFPAAAIEPGALTPTSTRTVCPWKGLARHYTVTVGEAELPDAAWCYPHPLPLARRVKGRIAFYGHVQIRTE